MPVPVLLVEDQPSDLLLLRRALRGMNLAIGTATCARDALAQAQQHDFALIVTDYCLPDADAPQLIQQLRASERAHYTPIILVTGTGDGQLDAYHYEKGAVDCLPKPVNKALLQNKVSVFCELFKQRRLIEQHSAVLERQKQRLEEAVRERELVEQALQESEIRYRTLLELSPVAILVQVDGAIVYVNTAVLHLLGVDERERFNNTSILQYFTPETRESGRAYVENLVRQGGRMPATEAEWLRQDRTVINVQITGACIVYDGAIGVQFAVLDITHRKQMERELHQLSRRDPLTQVSNRRAFDEALERECRRTKRNSTPIALILLDIDSFKLYNDHYGHQAGDAVIQRVARELDHQMRRGGDLVARYGGEEFVIILPETALRGARVVAERIREGIEALAIPHAHSPTAPVVTVSLGVVQAETCPRPEQLVEAADKALYQAKREGRNTMRSLQF